MQHQTDAELLRNYATNHSEAAFGEIVRRYADSIYSSALRQVGNEEQARDVTQTVFVDLARKAGSLSANTLLIGWLFRGARLAAFEHLRTEQRRQQRERLAMEMLDPSPEIPNDWNAVRPVLDEAIANLGNEDRDALMLRFFKNESLATVGATLGVSEDAAQKRVSRALGKLREFLEQRGIKTTAAALSAVLTANAVQSAPIGFAASLVTGALAKATIAGSSTTRLLKLFTFTNMKTAALIIALAGSIAALIVVKVKSQDRLREAQTVAQQRTEEIEALHAANERLPNLTNDLAAARRDAREVLRLRAEVTRLRRDAADLKAIASTALKPERTNEPTSTEFQQINIKAKFISVPASYFAGEATGTMTDPQIRMALRSLEKLDGFNLISKDDVTTLCGRQAQLQISPDNTHTNDPTFTVDVLPLCATNSRTINLQFSIVSEAMVELPPEDLPSNTPTRVRDVRTLQMTNSLNVGDGQTVVLTRQISASEKWLQGDAANNAMPKSLLILLTPTLIDPAGNRLFSEAEPLPNAEQSGNSSATNTPAQPNVFPGFSPQAKSP